MRKKISVIHVVSIVVLGLVSCACFSSVFAQADSPVEDNSLVLTLEQEQYIENNAGIDVIVHSDWQPMMYWDKGSQTYRGINIDVMNELSRISGLNFNFIPLDNSKECIQRLANGEVDIMFEHSINNLDAATTTSEMYLEVPTMFVQVNEMCPNGKATVAMPNLDSALSKEVMKHYPQFEYVESKTLQTDHNRLDKITATYIFIQAYDFNVLRSVDSTIDYNIIFTDIRFPFNIYLSPKVDPLLLSILNQSIGQLSPKKMDAIVFEHTTNNATNVSFLGIIKENSIFIVGFVATMFVVFAGVLWLSHRRTKHKLETIAFVDDLTKISTMAKFSIDTPQQLKTAEASEYMLLHLDVNNFKYINNSFGYAIGDRVLIAITQHFTEHLNTGDILARNGGDNFIFFIKSLNGSQLKEWFDRICDVNEHINDILPKRYDLVFSVGTYVISDISMELSTMLDKANIARKSIKGSHFSCIAEYTQLMDRQVEWEKEVTLSMQLALDNHEFEAYLQPKYNLNGEYIVGAEVLVRWNHPQKGTIPPSMFISLFEQNGFIQKIDFFMFEQVCIYLNRWKAINPNHDPLTISVNLSRLHLNNTTLVEDLQSLAQKYGVSTKDIEVELTESLVFLNSELLISIMHRLKEVGFKISIDDFGSGYSSLNLLKDLPIDIIKIDKVFLDEAADTNRGQNIISSVIEMTKKLDLITVAEGVETEQQKEMLREMGCDIVQGYYYAKPMPVQEFETRYIIDKEIIS